ncbi:uncharacterized protein LOC119986129 [Tripterygium wilfordii]|uniref:uncharacterized protein LOC119986129 n=1 Tax=Tripterygium wilfordii TaxID=458696 RepID=UPI0018F8493C|nr:uncharacterized protein LOC119986129 [Tripterygium wilfordii]
MASTPPWSDLHIDLLSLVFEKYGDDFEYLSSCASVCLSWRSAISKLSQRLLPKTPFLLLVTDDDHQDKGSQVSLVNIKTLKTPKIRVNPGLQGRWIRSCCHGWLLTIARALPHEINLLNPITGARIRLPSAGNQFNPSEGLTVVTSRNPLDSKSMVLGIYSSNQELVVCKPGDRTWTRIKHSSPKNLFFRSAIFYKGEFYVFSDPCIGHYDSIGRIRCDLNNSVHDLFMEELIRMPPPSPTAKLLFRYQPTDLHSAFVYIFGYLVELMDDLLIVLKYKQSNPQDKSRRFEVYRLKWEGEKEWVPVKSLGNNGIYLNRPSSTSVSIGEENSRECRANCIYFVERRDQWIDRGVYDMETKITQWSPLSNFVSLF